MVKIGLFDDAFLQAFLTAGKPSRRSITAAKRKEKEKRKKKEKKEKGKKDQKPQKFDFCAHQSQNVVKLISSG